MPRITSGIGAPNERALQFIVVKRVKLTQSPRPKTVSGRLQHLAKERPDLILMEIQLPTMDGYETMRRIRTDPALSSIPIIAVTAYAPSAEEQKARAAGCNDFVPKPYSPHQLLAKIRNYLH